MRRDDTAGAGNAQGSRQMPAPLCAPKSEANYFFFAAFFAGFFATFFFAAFFLAAIVLAPF
jgi:hypothetical protein